MSYILDALRRADAERERGRVPGIHAHAAPPPSADDAGAVRGAAPWRWIVGGVVAGLLVVAAAAWLLARGDTPASEAAMPPVTAPPPIPPAEARPAEAPPAAAPVGRAPDPALAPIEQRPTAESIARKAAAPAAARPGASAVASAEPVAASGPARIYARDELPEEIRRQLPVLSIGGSIYSPSPANRFVVVNGQVVHENGEVGPDHVLETIKLKSAVLRFKGYRYEITY